MSDLRALAVKCTGLALSSRDVDYQIYKATDATALECWPHWDEHQREMICPLFTGSIDRAISLRVGGWSYQLRTAEHHENGFVFECWQSWGPKAYLRTKTEAKTEAGAICAGWLLARVAVAQEKAD